MPIYEYICPDCKTKFELMRPISRCAEPAECPKCKHQAGRALSSFCCRSGNESGVTAPIAGGGGGCAGCGGGSCSSCGG
jgi:putative FmdB family regulatory protein